MLVLPVAPVLLAVPVLPFVGGVGGVGGGGAGRKGGPGSRGRPRPFVRLEKSLDDMWRVFACQKKGDGDDTLVVDKARSL